MANTHFPHTGAKYGQLRKGFCVKLAQFFIFILGKNIIYQLVVYYSIKKLSFAVNIFQYYFYVIFFLRLPFPLN